MCLSVLFDGKVCFLWVSMCVLNEKVCFMGGKVCLGVCFLQLGMFSGI